MRKCDVDTTHTSQKSSVLDVNIVYLIIHRLKILALQTSVIKEEAIDEDPIEIIENLNSTVVKAENMQYEKVETLEENLEIDTDSYMSNFDENLGVSIYPCYLL